MLKVSPNIDVLVAPTDTTSEDSVDHLEETVKSKFGVPESITESKSNELWPEFGRYLFLALVWEG
jgi:heptaprenylglyceryl phosphate synthase